ncbi:MAG: hypothetical protein IPP96_07565 [Chitinophagaceae bacterium]|nr:hypothetical protein [Chitinophagaceae bacterium]
MFKRITAILLLLAFSAQTFSSPFVMLDYYVNTAAYAKNCINKARPKMHCNGKCQMMKKLQEEEKKEQQNNEQRSEVKIQVLSSHSSFCSIPPVKFITLRKINSERKYPLSDISYSFFHPPQV